jgi:hypothetical protein
MNEHEAFLPILFITMTSINPKTFDQFVFEDILPNCLALYCFDYLENICFVYPAMSMIVIGHSLLY